MRIDSSRIVVDTYAWVEFFLGTEKGEVVKRLIFETDEVYTPDIVLAELARKYVREGVEESEVAKRVKAVEDVSTIVPVDHEAALLTAKAYLELVEHARALGLKKKPSLADAVVLAQARRLKARVVTGDPHFRGLPEVIWLGD